MFTVNIEKVFGRGMEKKKIFFYTYDFLFLSHKNIN